MRTNKWLLGAAALLMLPAIVSQVLFPDRGKRAAFLIGIQRYDTETTLPLAQQELQRMKQDLQRLAEAKKACEAGSEIDCKSIVTSYATHGVVSDKKKTSDEVSWPLLERTVERYRLETWAAVGGVLALLTQVIGWIVGAVRWLLLRS